MLCDHKEKECTVDSDMFYAKHMIWSLNQSGNKIGKTELVEGIICM